MCERALMDENDVSSMIFLIHRPNERMKDDLFLNRAS